VQPAGHARWKALSQQGWQLGWESGLAQIAPPNPLIIGSWEVTWRLPAAPGFFIEGRGARRNARYGRTSLICTWQAWRAVVPPRQDAVIYNQNDLPWPAEWQVTPRVTACARCPQARLPIVAMF
jgi:hypothetical protein